MRRPRYVTFTCPVGHTEERLVETRDDGWPLSPELEVCTALEDGKECRESMNPEDPDYAVGVGYLQTIVKGNHDHNERQRERLEKRSRDHWERKGKYEAADRQAAMIKKHEGG